MGEKVASRSFAGVNFRNIAIAVCVGVVYFGMLIFNPLTSLSGMASLQAFAKIRWAGLLVPIILASPSAAIGIFGASYMYNVVSGRIAFGAYSGLSFMVFGVYMLGVSLSKLIGRSKVKDLAVLAFMGASIGILVSANHMALAGLAGHEIFTKLVAAAVSWKVLSHILVFMAGYPLCLFVERKVLKK